MAAPGEVDVIGPGDVLQITVFEIGTALFSAGGGGGLLNSPNSNGVYSPLAGGENFPPVAVGRDGVVSLPYVGRLTVAGRTADEVQTLIADALKEKSQAPQVIVSIRDNVANGVVVMGDVKKPGRVPLTLARERVLDAVAAAGGGAYPTQDLIVRVSREGRYAQMRLDRIVAGEVDDLTLIPHDRVEVLYHPRSFTVFGAVSKVSEVPFQTPRVSLAEAIGRSGGPSDQQADPTAIFVFRFTPTDAEGEHQPDAKPVAYRLDMLRPQSYFLAQAFQMRPKDVIYVANARSNQLVKLVQILNLFFQPAYTAKVVSQ